MADQTSIQLCLAQAVLLETLPGAVWDRML